MTWRRQMEARRKVLRRSVPPNVPLRNRLKRSAASHECAAAMTKDAHLLEAALATDKIVLSADGRARALFSAATGTVGEIRAVVWLDVDSLGDDALKHVTDRFRRVQPLRLGAK